MTSIIHQIDCLKFALAVIAWTIGGSIFLGALMGLVYLVGFLEQL